MIHGLAFCARKNWQYPAELVRDVIATVHRNVYANSRKRNLSPDDLDVDQDNDDEGPLAAVEDDDA